MSVGDGDCSETGAGAGAEAGAEVGAGTDVEEAESPQAAARANNGTTAAIPNLFNRSLNCVSPNPAGAPVEKELSH